MNENLPRYELYAIRYASRDGRRPEHFLGGDPHDAPMPMDYFVWVAVSPQRAVVIDTGLSREVADKRGRTFLRCPIETLGALGIAPQEVEEVVLTHLHNDHAGNLGRLPKARFHLQEREIHFATGRLMRFEHLARPFEVKDVCDVIRLNFDQRMAMHAGAHEIAPGIRLHPAGGHSPGLQFVTVHTARGWVVVASDVSHFYENVEAQRPFRLVVNLGDMMEGFEALTALAPSPAHIIPGHDPRVMERYPAASPALEGIAVALHVPPHA
ncbi:N-acyl homoserine lactonase family protein [Afifella sp. IM 167]|uniref:N-acyl homoserine lactonase family protein n=1 Tax=Afifella sp. IM 167 TaxID=2033586 RepID=UPI001CCC5000|nr:N-acyl homoserine lactonase family protein [Afifella sp. IM 167]MBZ8132387.1 MBL fold hydrolase [Afifella sp. IM 167]